MQDLTLKWCSMRRSMPSKAVSFRISAFVWGSCNGQTNSHTAICPQPHSRSLCAVHVAKHGMDMEKALGWNTTHIYGNFREGSRLNVLRAPSQASPEGWLAAARLRPPAFASGLWQHPNLHHLLQARTQQLFLLVLQSPHLLPWPMEQMSEEVAGAASVMSAGQVRQHSLELAALL